MIHQSLHGYSDGHDLLATSLKLSQEQRILLSQMTDLSGPAPVRGFDGYLSGFPLPGGIYVLARTWYATELPRPGCVWTHSLLLMSDVLDQNSVLSLPRLFRRPESPERFDDYAEEVAGTERLLTEQPVSPTEIAAIVARLYGDSQVRVCVAAESAAELEQPFLAIWNQQWPSLRREFTFTTGMLGSGARAFDLQGIPSKNRRLFQESAGFTIVDQRNPALPEVWAMNASRDAANCDDGPVLRRFLWAFGNDFQEGRQAFQGLCETFQALSEPALRARALGTYDCIAKFFDKSSESAPLKTAVFGGQSGPWAVDELNALEVVARDGSTEIIEAPDGLLRERSLALPLQDLEELVFRIREVGGSGRVDAITDVFFERCEGANVARLPIGMASQVLKRRPQLARDAAVWQRSEDDAIALLRSLIAIEAFNDAVAYGLLRYGSLRLLYEAQYSVPRAWVQGAREYTDESRHEREIEEFILGRLWSSQSELRAELRSERFGQFLKLAAAVLDVSPREAEAFPLENVDIGAQLPRLHDTGAELQACAFLLILGLVRKEPAASHFMREGFSPIYLAAKEDTLPWDLWRRLELRLPRHFLEWDRCARLIEGAVIRFVDRFWSPRDFLKTFSTDEEFDRALAVLVSKGRLEYVQQLRSEAKTVVGSASAFQNRRLVELSE